MQLPVRLSPDGSAEYNYYPIVHYIVVLECISEDCPMFDLGGECFGALEPIVSGLGTVANVFL